MNPDDYMSSDPRYAQSIEGVSEGEKTLFETRKHPFGIISLYLGAGIGLLGALGLILILLPQLVSPESQGTANGILGILAIMGVVFTAVVLLIATYIYRQNRLIVTDRNITQVIQRGLFNRQVSELPMANVEDITADQKGLIATLFNYGEVRVETAGEQNNFRFNYCPRPNYCAKIIQDARQHYVRRGNQAAHQQPSSAGVSQSPAA
jgi:uncharacterized membrane protein YdbT with pleckstrin-like domain